MSMVKSMGACGLLYSGCPYLGESIRTVTSVHLDTRTTYGSWT